MGCDMEYGELRCTQKFSYFLGEITAYGSGKTFSTWTSFQNFFGVFELHLLIAEN
jgi:hypothetical protein